MSAEEKRKILKELGDIPEEVYDELVFEFAGMARQGISRMRSAVGDLGVVRETAHSLKGSSANLRLKEISTAAAAIEQAAKEGRAADVPARLEELERVVTRSFGVLP